MFSESSPLITGRIPYIVAIEALAASQDDAIPRELVSLREGTCDKKLAQYRVALDSGADPAVVCQWITEIQVRELAADARLRAATGTRPGPERMTKEQIAATVTAVSDLLQALRYATTEDKAEIYAGLKAGTRHSISADMVWRASPQEAGLCRTESNVMQVGEGAQARAPGGAAARGKVSGLAGFVPRLRA